MPDTKLRALVYDVSYKDYYVVDVPKGFLYNVRHYQSVSFNPVNYKPVNDRYMLPLEFMEVIEWNPDCG